MAVIVERFVLRQPFVIARGARSEAVVVTVTISDGPYRGRGECVPYARYGETVDSVIAEIEALRDVLERGLGREPLQDLMPAGAARNAVDCALWDLDAKRLGVPASQLAGLHRIAPATTAYTISLAAPDAMAAAARAAGHRPLLKLKLGGAGDPERVAAVRDAVPGAMLVVDANEAWTPDTFDANMAACERAGVALVEQPLPVGEDGGLRGRSRPVPICADESVHTRDDLDGLADLYDLVNIKLDKTGGLTEALALLREATARGLGCFVGCMVGTSLSMAPAMLLTPMARFVDLDGPLLLAADRVPGLRYDESVVHPPIPDLWG